MRRIGVLVILIGIWVGDACGDTVYFKSGKTYSCSVMGYSDGAFVLDLGGTTMRAQAIYVDRIEWTAATAPTAASVPVPAAATFATEPEPQPSEPTVQEAVPPVPPAVLKAKRTERLVLTTHWQTRLGRGDLALRDTSRLLSKCGTAQIDLAGKEIAIWGKINYLMPVQQAKKILGLGISTRSPITCAAFAPDSFFYHGFSGNFEDGFTRMYLITDYADQVVGMQWQDNTSRSERWFVYSEAYSEDWSLFNFVNNRKKGNPNWQIGFYVCSGSRTVMGYPPRGEAQGGNGPTGVNEGVIRVDSELYSITQDRYNYTADQKSRERNRLLLAQPIVDLMLYIAQKGH
jgi:hypothetical protein